MKVKNISGQLIMVGRFNVAPGKYFPTVPFTAAEKQGIERLRTLKMVSVEDVVKEPVTPEPIAPAPEAVAPEELVAAEPVVEEPAQEEAQAEEPVEEVEAKPARRRRR